MLAVSLTIYYAHCSSLLKQCLTHATCSTNRARKKGRTDTEEGRAGARINARFFHKMGFSFGA